MVDPDSVHAGPNGTCCGTCETAGTAPFQAPEVVGAGYGPDAHPQAAALARTRPAMLWSMMFSWLCLAMGMEPRPGVFHVSAGEGAGPGGQGCRWWQGDIKHGVAGGSMEGGSGAG
jgi:hypothetical protein